MANEPRKVPNLNMVICMLYAHHRKKLVDKGNLDPPSILVISLSKALNFLGDGSIYEGRA